MSSSRVNLKGLAARRSIGTAVQFPLGTRLPAKERKTVVKIAGALRNPPQEKPNDSEELTSAELETASQWYDTPRAGSNFAEDIRKGRAVAINHTTRWLDMSQEADRRLLDEVLEGTLDRIAPTRVITTNQTVTGVAGDGLQCKVLLSYYEVKYKGPPESGSLSEEVTNKFKQHEHDQNGRVV